MAKVGVVLVGAGRAGLVHGRNFAGGVLGAELVGIVEPDAARRQESLDELECPRGWASIEQALEHPETDAVVVTSPTPTHADLTIAALEAGKHVLCEKPLTGSYEDARRIAKAVDVSSGHFLMAFMRRFDSGFRRARQAILDGDIGEPILVKSMSRGPGLPAPWAWDVEKAGGLIGEVNAHDLDAVRWMSGKEYETVYAVGRAAKRPDIADEHPGFTDVVAATFTLTDGVIAQVDGACPADYGYDARIEVYGSEGVILAGDPRADSTLIVRPGAAVSQPVASWRIVFSTAYRAEDEHFIRVVRGLEEPWTTIEDGIRTLEATVAVNESVATGARVDVVPVAS